jgi:single-strand DNA-binding protein
MAASYNKVILMGNLTRDPELRYTPKGTAVAKIGLAVNRQWKSESGEQKEEVTFIDVEAWGRQAEVIAQYMKKGSPLFMDGRLKLDTWEDKNTKQKVSKLRVVLENFSFVGGGNREGGGGGGGGGYSQRPSSHSSSAPVSAPEPSEPDIPQEPDDVPF